MDYSTKGKDPPPDPGTHVLNIYTDFLKEMYKNTAEPEYQAEFRCIQMILFFCYAAGNPLAERIHTAVQTES